MGTGRVRRRPLRLVERKVLYSWLCLAPSNKISGGKVLSSRTRRSGSRAAALRRLAAVTIGRTDTALGAFYGRLSARIGKVKAIIATARKIAVRFYNAMRHGMDYSGASKLRIIWDARNGRIPWRESQTKDAIEWFHLRQPWRVLLRDPLSCAAHRKLIGVPKPRSRPPTAPAAVS